MSKILATFIITMLAFQCEEGINNSNWYVKNCTDRTLTIVESHTKVLHPGDSVSLCNNRDYRQVSFDLWLCNNHGVMRPKYCYILCDDILMKTWSMAEKDGKGKQFYNEQFWRFHDIAPKYENSTHYYFWTLEIYPEDIGL